MKSSLEVLTPSLAHCRLPKTRLRAQKMVAIALVSLACNSTVDLTGCNNMPIQDSGGFGPSGATVAGIALGVGGAVAATAILVHHSHHTVRGCILSGPNGLEVQNPNSTFELTGLTADLKAGDSYKLHGSKQKKAKHATGNQTFLVEKGRKRLWTLLHQAANGRQ